MLARRTPLKRGAPLKRSTKPIRRVSLKRSAELRLYSLRRKRYLADNPICEVWLRENRCQRINAGIFEIQTEMGIFRTTADYLISSRKAPRSTQIHHMNKRRGNMLLDENFWLAVCRENHERIENQKAWARQAGFLLNF